MDEQNQNGPAMSDEQTADLRALELAASQPDQAVAKLAEAEQQQVEQAEQSLVEKNAAALSMLCGLAAPTFRQFGFPTVAGALEAPHEAVEGMNNGQALAVAWAPVLAKYGVDLSNVSDKYKLEIAAVMMTLPVARALYVAVQVDLGKGKVRVSAAVKVEAAPAPATPAGLEVLGTAQPA